MKKIFIKYNPYQLETEITIDREKLVQNSKLREKTLPGSRLQEWVEELPTILVEEYDCREWEVTFHGTLLDFQDLKEVFELYEEQNEFTTKINHIAAKETLHKIGLIEEVFKKIQNGPFEELKDEEIKNAFEHAKSSDFEVCVVATMSAGKSTLINALLGTKLMPSKCEACTAIITRVKDNDEAGWKAKVYNQDNQLLETHEVLSYEKMVRLNDEKGVSVIEVTGDIPFVDAENVSLVLIDTPGPNNSRDPEHKRVQSEFLSKSSKSLVLYIMDPTFGTDDDHELLKRVANSMSVAGKQSKDRFIFIVNKMDSRNKEDGLTAEALNRIRQYLQAHGIPNPNLFPISALPALNIKLMTGSIEMDEDTLEETNLKIKRLNRNEQLHLESYCTLPASMKAEINEKLDQAKLSESIKTQALIHTGIVSLEAAIRQYVEKYAETAKIKNIVDTFIHKLDEVGCFEETKRQLAENQSENQKIIHQINIISRKIDDLKSAKNFENDVKAAVVQVNERSEEVTEEILLEFQKKLSSKINQLKGREFTIDYLEGELQKLENFAKQLEPEFQVNLDVLIRDNLIKTSEMLLGAYKKKLSSLIEEMDSSIFSSISIDPLKLMSGSLNLTYGQFERFIETKEVEDGEEWVANTDRKWYKPWTWFDEEGYYRKIYTKFSVIKGNDVAQQCLVNMQKNLYANADEACKQAKKQSDEIVEAFNKEFKRLDSLLKEKMDELKCFATEKDQTEKRIEECRKNLNWLEQMKKDLESILEI